jgi:nucleoside-diphosphate-sugar epimerase
MRVFVAGGTGAIGRPLVRALAAANHEIAVYSRSNERVAALGVPGIVPAVGDAFDSDTLMRAVQSFKPDVVINELTSLAQSANPLALKRGFDKTSRLRREVSVTLVRAARTSGARRIVAQSIAFAYKPGPGIRTEADPLWTGAKGQIGLLTGSVASLESNTLGDPDLDGVVLRYGAFYGPGTYFAPGGLYPSMLKRRVMPVPGQGAGIFGLVHLDDAAAATVAALEGPTGTFNVADDVPVPASELLSYVAALVGAKSPRHLPESVVRVGAGKFLAYLLCDQPAVSSQRARAELAWSPRYPDWHEGLTAVFSTS